MDIGYETGKMSLDRYATRMEALEEMGNTLHEQKAEVEAATGAESLLLENEEAFLEQVEQLNNFLRNNEPKRWKPVIKKIFKQIWLEPGYCTLEYRLPLPEGGKREGSSKRELALPEPVLSLVPIGPPGRTRTQALGKYNSGCARPAVLTRRRKAKSRLSYATGTQVYNSQRKAPPSHGGRRLGAAGVVGYLA